MSAQKLYTPLVLLLLFLIPGMMFAQNGKLSGTVTDAETGQPLPGANIILANTSMGAAANEDGEYTILNIPPGVYNVRATFIGYARVTIQGLRINADLTTRQNFELQATGIAGEEVTVVAERPLIQRTATNARRIIDAEEVNSMPVRGVENVALLQPGIVEQDGNIHIRGSREDEVGYYVEGANVRSFVTGERTSEVIPEALEEMQIQAGGYTAEYGEANAGIVSMVLREGSSNYNFTLRGETDQFTPLYEKTLGTYSYGYQDLVATAGGPIPGLGNNMNFFVAAENERLGDVYRRYFPPFNFVNGETVLASGDTMHLVDSGLRGGKKGETVDALEWKGGNTPNAWRNQYNLNGVLSFDLQPFKLRLSGTHTYYKRRYNDMPILNMLNTDRNPMREYSNSLLTAKLTHFLSPSTFYEFSLSYNGEKSKIYDPYFKDNFWLYSDSLANQRHGVTFNNATNDPYEYDIYSFPFNRPGQLPFYPNGNNLISFSKFDRQYIGGSFKAASQIGNHDLRFGGDLRRYLLRNFSSLGGITTGSIMTRLYQEPSLMDDMSEDGEFAKLMRTTASPDNYGYDVFGNETDSGVDRPRKPTVAAAYINDKYEIEQLVFNVGVRYDRFDLDARQPRNLHDPGFDPNEVTINPGEWEEVPVREHFSPRLGFGFPVTNRTVFHLQYGRFVQMPRMNLSYAGSSLSAQIFSGGFFYTNPVGYGFKPEQTTQYEIGFSQQFSNYASFDATLFYKDIKDQIQVRRIFPEPGTDAAAYDRYVNGDFATTRGLEFRVTLRRINRIRGFINYTFSQAKGTGSYVNQASASLDQATNQITVITPLYFSPIHKGSINLDYRWGVNDGGPILSRLGINVLFDFKSGHPFTLSTGGIGQNDAYQGAILSDRDARNRRPLEPVGSSETPWVFTTNLRVDKTVAVGPVDMNFYVYVQNLFNRKNVFNVYPRTGNAETDGFLENPDLSGSIIESAGGAGYVALYRAANLQNRMHYLDPLIGMRGDDLWGTPRQIRFGVSIEY